MTLRKRAARAGFEISLESQCASLVGELDEEIKLPGPTIGRMWTFPSVVRRQSRIDI